MEAKTMKIHVLTIIKEPEEQQAMVQTTLYANPEDAIQAYNQAVDEAKQISKNYKDAWEDHEIATDTPYRWWQVCDRAGNYESITIELDTKEVI